MSQSIVLIQQLKKAIKQSGKSYGEIAKELNCSLSNVKRMFSQEKMTLERFDEICQIIGTDIFDLVLQMRGEDVVPKSLSKSQEQSLVTDSGLFVYFYLLTRDWSPRDIADRFNVRADIHSRILLDLEKLEILEYLPNEKVRFCIDKRIQWRTGTPIFDALFGTVSQEFLAHSFGDTGEFLCFLTGEFSEHSAALLNKKSEDYARDISQIIAIDKALPKTKTVAAAALLAVRPWIFSLLQTWDGKNRDSVIENRKK